MEDHFYLGIDLDDKYAVLSCYEVNKKEPETFSLVAGSQNYQIPVMLAKKQGGGQWLIGEEKEAACVTDLFARARRQETVTVWEESYPADELFVIYLKKLFLLAGGIGSGRKPDMLVVCVETLLDQTVELFWRIAPALGFAPEQLHFIDRKESFYYFAYHQPAELCTHEVCLFDYRDGRMRCFGLIKRPHTTPTLVTMWEEERQIESGDRDAAFFQFAGECFRGRIVSSVYLTGDGFDGGWMQQSVGLLCQGRRAFMGKNLYAKGACYAAAIRDGQREWEYVYFGDHEMKLNVGIKVFVHGAAEFYTLIRAGVSWYEAKGSCEVLLDGSPELSFWLQPPESRHAKVACLELSDLPKRPNRTTRLRISAKALSDDRVQLRIRDLGFGEIFPGSGKVWEYVTSFAEEREDKDG